MAKIDLPSNSKNSAEKTDKKFNKVTKGKVTISRKNGVKKFADIFIVGDVKQVQNTIIYDMLIPAFKNLLLNTANSALNMLFFNRGGTNQNFYQPTQYQQFYNPMNTASYSAFYTRSNQYQYQQPQAAAPLGYTTNPASTIFASRGDAEMVLGNMIEALSTYGHVSVADFCELMGVTPDYTDYAYGWTDLHTAAIRPVNGGFVIDFPKAFALRK